MIEPGTLLLCGLLGGAVWFDLRGRRIPNALTFGGALAGLALLGSAGPAPATLVTAAAGWATGLVLLLPLYALGKLGAGDVKMLAMIGVFLGPLPTVWAMLWSLVFGGLIAIVWLIAHHGPRSLFRQLVGVPDHPSPMKAKMPYALALALGALFVLSAGAP